MQGHKHYQEKLFTSFRLSERVPEDNFYRRLGSSLDLSFLYKATEKYYGREGNPGIDPVVFFKLLLVGYFENLPSDRRIIEHSRLRLDILYFIGYDIDEKLPWHSTLSRTRQLYGEEVFQALFQGVLKLCIEKGMVAGKRQAIDSVLVKANASLDSLIDKPENKEILDDAAAYVAALEENAKAEGRVVRLPAVKKSNKNRVSATDPDARIATKPGKPVQLNYLGQVSVDTAHHVITNIEAHHADKRDSECLAQVLDHTLENLAGLEVEEVLADTNYSGAEALKAIDEKQLSAYIPNFGQYKPERAGFTYQPQGDYYQCTQGAKLVFKGIKANHESSKMKQYRSSQKDCKNCPLREACIGKSKCKTIAHSVDKALFDSMHEKMQTRHAKALRRLRQSTAEPVIGTLVNALAMKKVHPRGLQQANKHMLGAAIAYNLKKWLRWIMKKPAAAIAMPLFADNQRRYSSAFSLRTTAQDLVWTKLL